MLKWPNDLLVDDAKLAGVLAEAEFAGNAVRSVRGGDRHQRGLARAAGGGWHLPGSDRGEDRSRWTGPVLLDALLAALEPRRAQLEAPDGRRALAGRAAVDDAPPWAPGAGELGGEQVIGRADGNRRRRPPGGRARAMALRTLAAGDVVHLRPR